jgi:hypothetical protein
MQAMPKIERKVWLKTPYAKSKSQTPDAALQTLLERYHITDHEVAQGTGPNGRRAIKLRFVIRGKTYRLLLECLDADAKPEELLMQIKRALYWQLKNVLEMATVFFPLDEALFAYRELADGATLGEALKGQRLSDTSSAGIGRLLLPHKPTVAAAPAEVH